MKTSFARLGRHGLALLGLLTLTGAGTIDAAENPRMVSLVLDATPGRAAQHGARKLQAALRQKGYDLQVVSSLEAATAGQIVIAGMAKNVTAAVRLLREAGVTAPSAPEALAVKKTMWRGRPVLVLCGADDTGLMYAELDAADRIGWAQDAVSAFSEVRDTQEQPAIRTRELSVYTMNRAYWESRFYDEAYWTRYFDLLAANRFNRFLIIFGYETAGFVAPTYPYFFNTPGFPNVRMADLTAEQQRKNCAALNRLIELAHDRGIAVSAGIWEHIYATNFQGGVMAGGIEWADEYKDRPIPGRVQGVTFDNLNAYTLASLKEFLAVFPAIDGFQFRAHEESGLKREEMPKFWGDVFQTIQRTRPGLLIELRAKGLPDDIVDTAVSLGVNLRLETKYWMEQMGLPFHPVHVNPPDQHNRRHGYADLLRYPKRYDIDWRLWNGGTTRVLLWGDPEYVRRYSASTAIYDSPIWDVQEPLATKMEAQRPDAVPFELMPAKYRYYDYEFERYWHFYQVWGRVGYNPDTPPEVWRHEFERRFGSAAAPHVEAGLHRASQVLPNVIAAVDNYAFNTFATTYGWAERQSLGASLPDYAANTTTDPQLFESFKDAADRILAGDVTPRRTPEATSRWFDETAEAILADVAAAEKAPGLKHGNEFDSTMTDLRVLAGLARFHARRSLAAVHYNLYLRTRAVAELDQAVAGEKSAIAAWRGIVDTVGDRYAFDLAMGARKRNLCGHWRDELATLEAGLAPLEQERSRVNPVQPALDIVPPAKPSADREPPHVVHERIQHAVPLQPMRIVARVTDSSGVATVRLRYRHVTQFEDYAMLDMQLTEEPNVFAATVPADFIVPQWDFMYFIEVIDRAGNGAMWPDFSKEMPYVTVKLDRTATGKR